MSQKDGAGHFSIGGLLFFPLQMFGSTAPEPLLISDQTVTMTSLVSRSVTMQGASELHLTSPAALWKTDQYQVTFFSS
jgi:hypothetical protein